MMNPLVFPYTAVVLCAYGLLVLCALADGVEAVMRRVRQKGKAPDVA